MLISVIIPIYKVERYLRECVDSVLNQTYQNLEVILVDDGSPDGCPAICDDYAKRDFRVKVIHKPNSGLSDARNAGLKVATGDYVVFLDSDDYWSDSEAIQYFVEFFNANNPDIITFRHFNFDDSKSDQKLTFFDVDPSLVNGKNIEEVVKILIAHDWFIPSACHKFVRRELLNGIEFCKGIVCEDIDWNFEITLRAKRYFVSNRIIYAYRQRSGSITNTIDLRNINDLLWIVEKWSKKLTEKYRDLPLSAPLLSYCAYQLAIALGFTYLVVDKPRRKEYVKRVFALKWLFAKNTSQKTRKVQRLVSVLGVKGTGIALALYLKIIRKNFR